MKSHSWRSDSPQANSGELLQLLLLSLKIHKEAGVRIKTSGNPPLPIGIFLSGETFTSAVHPTLTDRLICI